MIDTPDAPILIARHGLTHYTVDHLSARLIGGLVIVDIQFDNKETVTLRISRAKAKWLRDRLTAAMRQ